MPQAAGGFASSVCKARGDSREVLAAIGIRRGSPGAGEMAGGQDRNEVEPVAARPLERPPGCFRGIAQIYNCQNQKVLWVVDSVTDT
jgi:hypothetical protein